MSCSSYTWRFEKVGCGLSSQFSSHVKISCYSPQIPWEILELMNVGLRAMWDEEAALPVDVWGTPISEFFRHFRLVETRLEVILIVGVNEILHLLHQVLVDSMVHNLQRHRQRELSPLTEQLEIQQSIVWDFQGILYLKEAPFLASVVEESHGLAPVLSIELAKVDHWNLHLLLQALRFSTLCFDASIRFEELPDLNWRGGIYRAFRSETGKVWKQLLLQYYNSGSS